MLDHVLPAGFQRLHQPRRLDLHPRRHTGHVRQGDGACGRQRPVDQAGDPLDNVGRDAAPARAAEHGHQAAAAIEHEGRSHGGGGPLAGLQAVGDRSAVHLRLRREIGHCRVEHEAPHEEAGSEGAAERRGQADGIPLRIDDGDRAGAVVGLGWSRGRRGIGPGPIRIAGADGLRRMIQIDRLRPEREVVGGEQPRTRHRHERGIGEKAGAVRQGRTPRLHQQLRGVRTGRIQFAQMEMREQAQCFQHL